MVSDGHIKRAAMLAALAETGNVSRACEAANVGRSTYYQWLNEEPDFAASADLAMEQAADKLEEEARRRAHDGVDEPVFYQGDVCGTVRRYSDTLLIFLLKGARPKKFRDNVDHTSDGKPLPVVTFVLDNANAAGEQGS